MASWVELVWFWYLALSLLNNTTPPLSTFNSTAVKQFTKKFQRLCSRLRRLVWRRSKPRVIIIRRLGKRSSKAHTTRKRTEGNMPISDGHLGFSTSPGPIRIATFNAALFSLAPAVPRIHKSDANQGGEDKDLVRLTSPSKTGTLTEALNLTDYPKSILKHSPWHLSMNRTASEKKKRVSAMSKRKVSINLPDNEISLAHKNLVESSKEQTEELPASCEITGTNHKRNDNPVRSPICFPDSTMGYWRDDQQSLTSGESILEVLRGVDADILALQDVRAEEEKGMAPLSDLAAALGMFYVFAESWAPEYGNAVLSKWPIKRWRINKIADDEDFRNVLRVTIEVPWAGEIDFHCTQLDHLNENWRMKQVNAIIQSTHCPHILAGGLNSLSGSDYSSKRWSEITQYYEDMGKPAPRVQVMNFLKHKGYVDAGDSVGDCEPVVIIAKGQSLQGTCKYGTRVDYILASEDSPFKFVPGSYSVISSKGTSDHHIVKVDVMKPSQQIARKKRKNQIKPKIVRTVFPCSHPWPDPY